MKLTPTQLQTIETYLLSWELQFRDFYDEMFDHFCTEIEQRMDESASFDNAFAETSYLFSDHEYRVGLSQKFYGLKAYEMEWFEKVRKKNNLLTLQGIKSQVLSTKLLIWVSLYALIYGASVYFELPKLWGYTLVLALFTFLYTYSYIYFPNGFTWRKFFKRRWINLEVHQSKDTLLQKRHTFAYQSLVLIGMINLILNAPNLYESDFKIPMEAGTAFSVFMLMMAVVYYNVVKKSLNEKVTTSNVQVLKPSKTNM